MIRSIIFLFCISFFSCHKKIIPAELESKKVISIYQVYVKGDDPLKKCNIDFASIENLESITGSYYNAFFGFVKNKTDIDKISEALIKNNKNAGEVRFLWSSKPIIYDRSKEKAYVLFAVKPYGSHGLKELNQSLVSVKYFVHHETFEPGIQLNYDLKGKAILEALVNDSPLTNKSVAYVIEGAVWDIRKLHVGYHETLIFMRFENLKEAELKDAELNKKLHFNQG